MIANATLKSIKVAAVARVYSGKPGCMCGCNGRYSETKAQIARVVAIINAALAEGRAVTAEDGYVFLDDTHIETYYTRRGLSRQVQKGRVYCAYFAKQS